MFTRATRLLWPTASHALGIHLSPIGAQAVWLSRERGQAPVCQRVWTGPALDLPRLREEGAWPRACPLYVAFDDTVDDARLVRLTVALAPGLSGRDRRFQHMAEVVLQHPEWGNAVSVEEDAQGRVCAIDPSWLAQWRAHARTLGCQLRGLSVTDALPEDDEALTHNVSLETVRPTTDWRTQEALALTPLAWRAACLALDARALTPNWALTPWSRAWRDARVRHVQPILAWCRVAWRVSGMTARLAMGATLGGAVVTTGLMHGLQAIGQWRDALTQSEARIAQLQSEQRALQQWQADETAQRQAQRQLDAQQQQAWQPMRASTQASVQWTQAWMQAQGVWLHEWSLQAPPTDSAHPNTNTNPRATETPMQWQLRGEALSPDHAYALLARLQALPIWHKPPAERSGHWVHGQDGRLSVWAFEWHAQWMRPW